MNRHAVMADIRAWADQRRRRIPPLSVGAAAGPPSVYYLLPDTDRPQGGIRVAYRHVDLLNSMGQPAAVLHRAERFRASWFENSTRVVGSRTARLRENDVLVVPEWFGPAMSTIDPSLRVLVFNQGAYITFDSIPLESTRPGSPYADLYRFAGIMTVSRDSADLLSLAYPTADVRVARPVVDPTIFWTSDEPRERSIAYVPTRRRDELNQLLHTLRATGVDWPLRPISGLSEKEVGEAMRRSAIFLSLSDRDGFGMPPAEAMACGAYVIGYPGGGGEEYFDPAFSMPIRSTAEFVRAVQDATTRPLAELAEMGRKASSAILDHYHEDGLRSDLEVVFGRLVEMS